MSDTEDRYVLTAEYRIREAMNGWYRDDNVRPHGRNDPTLPEVIADQLIHDPAALTDLVRRSAAAFRRTPEQILGLDIPTGDVIVTPREPVSERAEDLSGRGYVL